MKKLLITIILILVILSSTYFYYSVDIFKQTSEKNGISVTSKEESSNQTYYLYKNYTFSKPKILEEKTFFKIIDENADSFTLEEIDTRVPVYTTVYTFPLGTVIEDISFEHSIIKKIKLSKKLSTCSLPVEQSFNRISFKSNEKDTDEIYPDSWYRVTYGGGISEGNRTMFFTIHTFPIRYSESEKTVYHIENAKIRFFVNKSACQNKTNSTYDLIIITPREFSSSLSSFIKHKNDIGIRTKSINVEDIYNQRYFITYGRDKQEKIKLFIKNAAEKWGIKYVILVGDINKIPGRYYHAAYNRSKLKKQESLASISDLYYSDLYYANGSFCDWDPNNNNIFGENNWEGVTEKIDYYPDVYLGRLNCKTTKELDIVLNKIISYENNNNKEWFNNIILIGGDTFTPLRCVLAGSGLRPKNILSQLIYNSSEIFLKEGEYMCDIVAESMKDFNQIKIYSSNLFPDKNNKPLLNFYIRRAINDGAGFVYFSGHGNPSTYATYKFPALFRKRPILRGFSDIDVIALRNRDKLPIVVLDACSCGKLDDSSCIAWNFIKKSNGGAIAALACTNISYGYHGSANAEGLNGYMAAKFFDSYSAGDDYLGQMFVDAQNNYLNMHSTKFTHDYLIISIWEIFGDPSLKAGN